MPPAPQPGLVSGGGRTLAGGFAPSTSTRGQSSSSSRPAQRRTGLATLGDYSGGGGGHGHAHGDDENDEDEDDPGQNMFAGGEKSGIAVQNPNPGNNNRDLLERIMGRARENRPRPGGDEDEEPAARQNFGGRGVTLGGDDTPSTVIEDPRARLRANEPPRLPRVTRTLHIWSNGFSIDDGPLMDPNTSPENARILQMILAGHAPLSILNVAPGQEVDLNVDNQKESKFVQPKKKYVPFGGSGQRLGEESADASSAPTSSQSAAPAASASSTSAGSSAPSVDVDSSQPTVTLQLRLGDGTRLQSRFNTTHTIGDVYAFVAAASPASRQRAFVLSSTFPPKDFEDMTAVLGDLPEFKRGGVMVQKWK